MNDNTQDCRTMFALLVQRNTDAHRFVNSPEVTAFCVQKAKERAARNKLKLCECGNDCSSDEFNDEGFFAEYICKECR